MLTDLHGRPFWFHIFMISCYAVTWIEGLWRVVWIGNGGAFNYCVVDSFEELLSTNSGIFIFAVGRICLPKVCLDWII